MIEQHRTDEMTEARTARAKAHEERTSSGVLVCTGIDEKTGNSKYETFASLDWSHYHLSRRELSSSEAATFDLAFLRARQIAGVRASVDLALAEMRKKLMHRLGKPSWRAG